MTRPIAVLGLGGIGGMLAVRTGALCVGTERTVAAIRERGLRSSTAETTTRGASRGRRRGSRRRSALLVVAVKAYDLDGGSRPGRAGGARRSGGPPAPERPRARRGDPGARRRPECRRRHTLALRRGRVDRPGVRVVARAGSRRPGDAHGRDGQRRLARAGGQRRSPSGSRRSRVPGIEVVVGDDEGAVLWEKAARLVGARRRDGRRRAARSARSATIARGARASRRRSPRRARSPPPTASSSTPLANGRSSRACPTT